MRYSLIFMLSSLGAVFACGGPPSSDEDAGTGPSADASSAAVDSGSTADSGRLFDDAGSVTQDAGSSPVDVGSQLGLQPNICSIWESQIFSGCANGYCHGGGQAGGFRLDHRSAQALHESIVNVDTAAGLYYVVPENDRMSYLINKLEGTQDQSLQGTGDRMPPGGPYFSFDQIEVLRQWIAAGASNECP